MIRVIKFKKSEIKKPDFDPHPEKSTTNNHAWRVGLIVTFVDHFGNEFEYMPKWDNLEEINKKKSEVEAINKRLCFQHNQGGDQHAQ